MAVQLDPQATLGAGQTRSAPVDAHDFRQFAALRRADPNDPKALREVARQFESIFTKMMLESMRSASFGDPMFGSDQAEMYQGLMDDQLAVQLTSGRGIGLADMLFRQLSQGAATAPGAVRPASAASSPPSADEDSRRQFVAELLPHARAAAVRLGVDERSIVAQAALETGWGRAQPADDSGSSHNFFGIKAGAHWRGASVESQTLEYVNGVAVREPARFRSYGSVAESLDDYVDVIQRRYANAANTGSDVRAFATALQRAGYATDPQYAEKLVAVAATLESLSVKSFKSADPAPIDGARNTIRDRADPSLPMRTHIDG